MRSSLAWLPLLLVLCLTITWGAAPSSSVRPSTKPTLQGPSPALTFPAQVLSCHDGDTVLVEIRWRANVRLADCWAKELREPGGKESLAHIQQLTKARTCLLSIPLEGARTVGDVLTFGRIVGEIWMDGECESINMRMVQDGFATKKKQR